MSNTIDPEVLDRLLEILDKPYKCAKLGILDLESKSRRYSPSQILRLRDVLDHIATALIEYCGEKEKQLKSLDLAEDHLRILLRALKFLQQNSSFLYWKS